MSINTVNRDPYESTDRFGWSLTISYHPLTHTYCITSISFTYSTYCICTVTEKFRNGRKVYRCRSCSDEWFSTTYGSIWELWSRTSEKSEFLKETAVYRWQVSELTILYYANHVMLYYTMLTMLCYAILMTLCHLHYAILYYVNNTILCYALLITLCHLHHVILYYTMLTMLCHAHYLHYANNAILYYANHDILR